MTRKEICTKKSKIFNINKWKTVMKFARVKLFVLGLVEWSQTGVVLSPAYFVNTLCTTHRSTDALHSVTPAALSTS